VEGYEAPPALQDILATVKDLELQQRRSLSEVLQALSQIEYFASGTKTIEPGVSAPGVQGSGTPGDAKWLGSKLQDPPLACSASSSNIAERKENAAAEEPGRRKLPGGVHGTAAVGLSMQKALECPQSSVRCASCGTQHATAGVCNPFAKAEENDLPPKVDEGPTNVLEPKADQGLHVIRPVFQERKDEVSLQVPDEKAIEPTFSRDNSKEAPSLGLAKAHSQVHALLEEERHCKLPPISEVGVRLWLCTVAELAVESLIFNYVMGAVILAHALFLGLESQLELDGKQFEGIVVVESMFLICYILELGLRFGAHGMRCFMDAWIWMDAGMIAMGITSNWFMGQVSTEGSGPEHLLGTFMILRMLRVLRLVRALKVMTEFRTMCLLVSGLMSAMAILLSTLILLLLALYAFACLAVELITKNETLRAEPGMNDHVNKYFGSLPRTMMTLFQFVTSDGIAEVYMPLITLRPLLLLYFVPVFFIVTIALMNLVTAVIVEGALAQAGQDREMEKASKKARIKRMTPKLRQMFKSLSQGDGVIQVEELVHLDIQDLPEDFHSIHDNDSMVEVFEMFDVDGSGEIEEEEFVDGLLNMALVETPVETMVMMKLLREQRMSLKGLNNSITELHGGVGDLHNAVGDLHTGYSELHGGLSDLHNAVGTLQTAQDEIHELNSKRAAGE